ncbi:TetR/AcrR family transcriptional regulator, partial [bacterium]
VVYEASPRGLEVTRRRFFMGVLNISRWISDACCRITPERAHGLWGNPRIRRLGDRDARLSRKIVTTIASCPNKPKTDPRVLRTRKLLEDAFHSLRAERPYGEISVGDIAERATVNRATFYAHFEDKHHLATTSLRTGLEAALHNAIDPPTAFTPERLERAGVALFEFIAGLSTHCPSVRDELGEAVGATLQGTFQAMIAYWIEHDSGATRRFSGSSPATVAATIAWSLYGGALEWSRTHHRTDAATAVHAIVRLLVP